MPAHDIWSAPNGEWLASTIRGSTPEEALEVVLRKRPHYTKRSDLFFVAKNSGSKHGAKLLRARHVAPPTPAPILTISQFDS